MEILELSENEVNSYISSICQKTNCKTIENLLTYIKQSEIEPEEDLVLRYMELFDTFLQRHLSGTSQMPTKKPTIIERKSPIKTS